MRQFYESLQLFFLSAEKRHLTTFQYVIWDSIRLHNIFLPASNEFKKKSKDSHLRWFAIYWLYKKKKTNKPKILSVFDLLATTNSWYARKKKFAIMFWGSDKSEKRERDFRGIFIYVLYPSQRNRVFMPFSLFLLRINWDGKKNNNVNWLIGKAI